MKLLATLQAAHETAASRQTSERAQYFITALAGATTDTSIVIGVVCPCRFVDDIFLSRIVLDIFSTWKGCWFQACETIINGNKHYRTGRCILRKLAWVVKHWGFVMNVIVTGSREERAGTTQTEARCASATGSCQLHTTACVGGFNIWPICFAWFLIMFRVIIAI